LNPRTICNCVAQSNFTGFAFSGTSPLAEIEPVIVDCCLRLATMGCALNMDQVLTLSTDLIQGRKCAKQLMELKKMLRLPELTTNNQTDKVKIGEGWYCNFMNQHKDTLMQQILQVKDAKRSTYCTYQNFLLMYDTVHEGMVKCNIAEKLDNDVNVNIKGKNETNESKFSGLPTKYILHYPDLIVFVDKTGCNTNQKLDPLNGNKKCIVRKKTHEGFGFIGSVTNNHYSVLCFQTATGEPIMCAIVFNSERKVRIIPQHWIYRINIQKLKNMSLPDNTDEIALMYVTEAENGAIGGGPV
jgi:hypothetical protein